MKKIIIISILLAMTIISWERILALDSNSIVEMSEGQKTLQKLLPSEKDLPGWKQVSEPRFFEPGNLWEYIDGQAELYLQYGFQLVITSDYAAKDSSNPLIIEIYQMESPLHGFGIYAAERSPEDNFIKVGVQGYIAEDILNFWKGPYYVKITLLELSESSKETMLAFSKVIADKIDGDYAEPELFACFPEKNKIKMSERYIPKNFLGHRFLKNGYRVDYQQDELRYQVFLTENSSPAEAEEAFAKYHDFLKSNSEIISHEKKEDYQKFKVQDRKKSVIFLYQSFLGGVLRIEDFSGGDEIIEEVLNKLKNRKNNNIQVILLKS